MTTPELDTIFLKALKYLHSKSKDSADKLKKLLDDAIAQRTGQKPDRSDIKTTKLQRSEDSKREVEKRIHDKITSDQDVDPVPAKKAKKEASPYDDYTSQSKESPLETSSSKVKESTIKTQNPSKLNEDAKEKVSGGEVEKMKKDVEKKQEKKEPQEKEDESTDEENSFDADDFASGLGIACGACNRFEVTSGNRLVECQECHTLYHQECHKPPVTEEDVSDPRFVWYCYKCKKTMKKMQVKSSGKSKMSSSSSLKELTFSASSSATSASSPTTPTISKSNKAEKMDPTSLFSFRRVDNKPNLKESSSSSGNKPLSGFESLAANLSGKGDATRSLSSKSETSKTEGTKSSHLKGDSSKSGHFRQDFTKGTLQKEKSDSSEKSSKPAKSADSVKITGGGIKLDIDLFKGPPKAESSKSRPTETGKASGKSSDTQQKSKSSADSGSRPKTSESVRVIKSASELVKLGSRSGGPTADKTNIKIDSSKMKSSSSSSSNVSSSSSGKNTQGGSVSFANADKRLQKMKKNAAAKQQDRRSSYK